MRKLRVIFFALLSICGPSLIPAGAATVNDAYITGYAAALLEHEFHVPTSSLQVQNGVIRVSAADLTSVNREQLIKSLSEIPGVVQVELFGQGQVQSATPLDQRQPDTFDHNAIQTKTTSAEASFLAQGYLFDQLSADPRWPHFSIAYQYYINDKEL